MPHVPAGDPLPPDRASEPAPPSSSRQLAWLALIALLGFVLVYLLLKAPWGAFFEDRPGP